MYIKSINQISIGITEWCDKKRKLYYIENSVIEYEIELFIENIIKLFIITIMGVVINRGIETIIILSVFCILRYHAGGYHMKTNVGCMAIMTLIWALSLGIGENIIFSSITCIGIYIVVLIIFICCAPADFSYKHIYSLKEKKKKKIISLLIVTFFFLAGTIFINNVIRGVVIVAICLEAISILPIFKRGGKHNEVKE